MPYFLYSYIVTLNNMALKMKEALLHCRYTLLYSVFLVYIKHKVQHRLMGMSLALKVFELIEDHQVQFILRGTLMSNSIKQLLKDFTQNQKPHDGARGKVRESLKSLEFIVCEQ